MIVNPLHKTIKEFNRTTWAPQWRKCQAPPCSTLTLQSDYRLHFRGLFFTLRGAKCVPVKGLRWGFVTAILDSKSSRATRPLTLQVTARASYKPGIDVNWTVGAPESPPSSALKETSFSHLLLRLRRNVYNCSLLLFSYISLRWQEWFRHEQTGPRLSEH